MRTGVYILLGVSALLFLSCGKSRVIPPDTLSDIYADMFLADQWLRDNGQYKKEADTSDFYASAFEKYGYTFEDFDRSVQRYLTKPKKYTEILEKSVESLDGTISRLREEQERKTGLEKLERYLREHSPAEFDFAEDTLLWTPDSLKIKRLKDTTNVIGTADSVRTGKVAAPRELLGREPLAVERKDMQF